MKKIIKLHSLTYLKKKRPSGEGSNPGFVFPASFILSQRLTLELLNPFIKNNHLQRQTL